MAPTRRRNPPRGPAAGSTGQGSESGTAPAGTPPPAPEPAPEPAPAPVPPPAPEPGPAPAVTYTEADLQRLLRICMAAKGPSNDEPRESPLKARFPDRYSGKSHMDCFHFCQQCEDHFETA